MKSIIIFLLNLLMITTSSAQAYNNALKPIVDSFLQTYKVPAIAASVVKADTVLYGITGVKRQGTNQRVDFDSKFHIGSNTKAITAMIAARLVEEGGVKWDTKITEAVRELEGKIHPAYNDVTLENLLSNRGKVQPFEEDNSKEWKNMPSIIGQSENSKLAFTQYALNLKPAIPEDKNHVYSNGGFIAASLMLESASGKSWEELVVETFSPLDFDYYIGFPSQENPSATYGHQKKLKKYRSVAPEEEYPLDNYFAPAGNLSMNIVDLSELMQLHLLGLLGENNILKSESFEQLHFGFPDYALGWYNGNIGETTQKFSYHGGSLGTYSSAIMLSADREVAIVILVNSDDKNTTKLKNELRTLLWQKYGND